MNDEIKEILEKLKDREETYQFCKQHKLSINDWIYEAHFLLDYVLDLQVENEMMRKLIDKGVENSYIKLKDLQARIDKAIEYIDKVKCINNRERDGMHWEYDVFFPELLNILQNGSDSQC